MLVGRIVSNKKYGRRIEDIAHARCDVQLSRKRSHESGEIRRAMVIEVVGLQHHTCKFRKQIILFIGCAVRAYYANCLATFFVADFRKMFPDQLESFFPGGWCKTSFLPNQRLLETLCAVGEIECIASLDAQEIAVDAAFIAVIAADDLHASITSAHAQGGFTTVATMCADGAHMLHLPWPGLIAVCARSQSADRTDVNAHAALFALQMIFLIGSNDRDHTPVLHTQSPDIHAFTADTHAPVAQNAAWPIEINHR